LHKSVAIVSSKLFLVLGLAAALAAATARADEVPAPTEAAVHLDAATPPAPEQVAAGKSIFGRQCARCHGFNMVKRGGIAFDLRKFPPDDPDRFVHSVTKGKGRNMPPWGSVLSMTDIQALWAYVRSNHEDQ